MKTRFSVLFVIFFSALTAPARGGQSETFKPPPKGKVRIIRDTFGVPHVIAADQRSLFFGAGYAQAEDQLENICLNYLGAAGRIAERQGSGQLEMDHLVRMFRLRSRAEKDFNQLDPDIRVHFESFAEGINAYIKQNRGTIPEWIRPVTSYDVVAFSMYVDLMFSVSHCRRDLQRAGIRTSALDRLLQPQQTAFGSNQFAIASKRSATKAAMLSMDPHLPLSGFYRWYEMHLVGPGIDVMGASFFGTPYVGMGRTARTTWCMTVNGPDLGDVFAFKINKDDPTQFRGPDGWESFETYEETYRVLVDGKLVERKMPVLQTPVGPVVTTKDGTAYAAAVPQTTSLNAVRQLYDMARAKNLAEFKHALDPLGLVMFNIVYADADGHIFYISNGRVPKRDTRIRSTKIRPGHKFWARWQGYHKRSELPQVEDPPDGFLMNCNSGPQNVCTTGAPQPDDFPPYMMSQRANSRSRRLRALIEPDKSITWAEMHTYAADTHIEEADRLVPVILEVIQKAVSTASPEDRKTLTECGKVLAAWDGRTDLDSRGAVLFNHILKDDAFQRAIRTRRHDDNAICPTILAQAARVKQRFGAIDAPWGEYSRIRRGNIETGCAGSGDTGGATLRPTYGPVKDGKRYAAGGSSYHMIIDFSGKTRSISCLPFGQSEHPDSPHFADQLPLYAKRKYKPAPFRPDEVKKNAESDRTIPLPGRYK